MRHLKYIVNGLLTMIIGYSLVVLIPLAFFFPALIAAETGNNTWGYLYLIHIGIASYHLGKK